MQQTFVYITRASLYSLEEAQAPLRRGGEGLKSNGGRVEGECDGVGELGVHEEGLGGRGFPPRQLLLDLTDEADGNPLLKLVDGCVQVEDLDDLKQQVGKRVQVEDLDDLKQVTLCLCDNHFPIMAQPKSEPN